MLTIKKFSSTWCQPCKVMKPIFDQAKAKYADVDFISIDVDEEKEYAQNNNVRSIPTTIFYKDGNEVHRATGVITLPQIDSLINQLK